MTEQELQQLCGKENPFRVPNGYFETFNKQMMAKIAATSQKRSETFRTIPNRSEQFRTIRTVLRLRPLLATAACICVAIFALALIFNQKVEQNDNATAQYAYNDEYIEDVIDYAMLDNGDLYAYMMEE